MHRICRPRLTVQVEHWKNCIVKIRYGRVRCMYSLLKGVALFLVSDKVYRWGMSLVKKISLALLFICYKYNFVQFLAGVHFSKYKEKKKKMKKLPSQSIISRYLYAGFVSRHELVDFKGVCHVFQDSGPCMLVIVITNYKNKTFDRNGNWKMVVQFVMLMLPNLTLFQGMEILIPSSLFFLHRLILPPECSSTLFFNN